MMRERNIVDKNNVILWDKVFLPNLYEFMVKVSDESEDDKTIREFEDYCKENVDCQTAVILAVKWGGYTNVQQAGFAIHYGGEYHASRFMMLIDFMYMRYKEGKLV